MSYSVPPPQGRHHMAAGPRSQMPGDQRDAGPGPSATYPPGRDGIPDGLRPGGWADRPGYREPQYPPPATYEQPMDRYMPPPAAEPPPRRPPVSEQELTRMEEQWADVRRLVALEVKSVNAKHCHHAFDLLGKRGAVAPNGVILFYTAPDPDPKSRYGYLLFKVTRLAFAGPEYDDLPRMLRGLRGAAEAAIERAQLAERRWDPRGPESSLVNGGDMDMPRDARFIGTAAETLHTDVGDWYTVARSIQNQPLGVGAKSVFDLTGQGFVHLIDGTVMHVVRDNNRHMGDDGVRCNKSTVPGRTYFQDRYPDLTTEGDQATRDAWTELTNLHNTLAHYLTGSTEQ